MAPCQSYLLDADYTSGKGPSRVSERLNLTVTSPRNGLEFMWTLVSMIKERLSAHDQMLTITTTRHFSLLSIIRKMFFRGKSNLIARV